MHDSEKSDSGVVAMKPTNKAGRPAAESVEPRPGTKGNADQQNTHRTQGRARVTQALDRVRKAGRTLRRQTPKFRFPDPDGVLAASHWKLFGTYFSGNLVFSAYGDRLPLPTRGDDAQTVVSSRFFGRHR